MDRQNRRPPEPPRILHRRPPRPCPCKDPLYQPQWLTGADRTMAVAAGSLRAGVGEAVSFTDGCDAGDAIRLHAPGIYYAHLTLHMPAHQPVRTEFCLRLNGETLPESSVIIDHDGDHARHACAQAMFEIDRPGTLQLMTALPLQIACDGPAPLITLAVFRIA